MTMQEGDSGTHSTALRAGSGRNGTKAERRDRIYSGMTEAKCHASKRKDNVKGMSLDSSPYRVRMTVRKGGWAGECSAQFPFAFRTQFPLTIKGDPEKTFKANAATKNSFFDIAEP